MPSIEWNKKWENMILDFEPNEEEQNWGDRWGDPHSLPHLLQVRTRFVDPYIRPGQHTVEIGPGGGRFTQFLLGSEALTLVDLNPATYDYICNRFPEDQHKFSFYQTRGSDLEGVPSNSQDLVFTFDCFVHVEPNHIQGYLHEIERVLKPGGRAVIHYGDKHKDLAKANPGFSHNTQEIMRELISKTALRELDHDTYIMFHSNLVTLEK